LYCFVASRMAAATPDGHERVALFYSANTALHTFEWPHIEKCTRASDVFAHLSSSGVVARCTVHDGHRASDEELLAAHTPEHVDEVRRMSEAAGRDPTNRELREPDGPGGVYYSGAADDAARCVVDSRSLDLLVALSHSPLRRDRCQPEPDGSTRLRSLACGCVIDAASHVLRDTSSQRCAFALVRPPGHHAGFDDTPNHRAEGFCFFNSVAVAARCVLAAGAASRVCILDWDVHHGNGTQKLLQADERILYVSLHRYGAHWYPESGAMDEVGVGSAAGNTVNIAWPADGLGDTDYVAAWSLLVLPIIRAFAPQLVLISAGFDAADGDVQGRMRLTPAGFAHLTAMLLHELPCPIAAALCAHHCTRPHTPYAPPAHVLTRRMPPYTRPHTPHAPLHTSSHAACPPAHVLTRRMPPYTRPHTPHVVWHRRRHPNPHPYPYLHSVCIASRCASVRSAPLRRTCC
jgi:acetoin utilization deacetylase AcuC-like enzyme